MRKDIQLVHTEERSSHELLTDIINTGEHLLLQNHGPGFVSSLLDGFFLSVILASFVGLLGKRYMVISLWMIGTILMAIISKGYVYYGIDFRLHRSLVIVPVFLALCAFILAKYNVLARKKIALIVIGFVFFSGMYYQQQFLQQRTKSEQYQLIMFLKQQIAQDNIQTPNTIYFIGKSPIPDSLHSLTDTLPYFIPTTTVEHVDQEKVGEDCNEWIQKKGMYIISEIDACTQIFVKRYIGAASNKPHKYTLGNKQTVYLLSMP